MAAKAALGITPLVAMGATRSLTPQFMQCRHSAASSRDYRAGSDSEEVRWVSVRGLVEEAL